MKLNEILDPSQRERILQNLGKMYAPRPQSSPEELKNRASKADAHERVRREAEALLEPIAKKYSGDDFEGFQREAEFVLSPAQANTINLKWAFDFFNPERRKQSAASWEDLANEKLPPDHYRGD